MNHRYVVHPRDLLKKEEKSITKFNTALALKITNGVGSMWAAYLFCLLALLSLPAILVQGNFVPSTAFPKWLISVALISLVAWIAQTFIQLVLLPIIMVGQNVIQSQNDAKAEVDHNTLTFLANISEETNIIQKEQLEILKELRKTK